MPPETDTSRPLRILMVLHMPWDRNLGGSRIQLELAEEFTRAGHHVEKFDSKDAFPHGLPNRLAQLFQPVLFSRQARRYVRANGARFDVVDAHQGNLPTTKAALGFGGVLVARSVGLAVFYEEFERLSRQRWPTQAAWKALLWKPLLLLKQTLSNRHVRRSFRAADLITVLNGDECRYLEGRDGLGGKCRVHAPGLTEARAAALEGASIPPAQRLASKKVVFVGSWEPRKGRHDWPQIVAQVRAEVPTARFLLLGTGVPVESVTRDLGEAAGDWVQVVPHFEGGNLPALLADATVGIFPSYIEGFGIAVLEKLAAGIPTVAYDVIGPREMLAPLAGRLLAPVGDVADFVRKTVAVLTAEPDAYVELAALCRREADRFRLAPIARRVLAAYREKLPR